MNAAADDDAANAADYAVADAASAPAAANHAAAAAADADADAAANAALLPSLMTKRLKTLLPGGVQQCSEGEQHALLEARR